MPVPGDILTYSQMLVAENARSLQKGMHFRPRAPNSILLMSRRPNAPYKDEVRDDGRALIYEGHDIRPDPDGPDPKSVDQPLERPGGALSDNGKFWQAAKAAENGAPPLRVHVYEKLKPDVWVFNGAFALVSAWIEQDGPRKVCKFKLNLIDDARAPSPLVHNRVIPGDVKVEVWKRDAGRCAKCGSVDNLHFDHILPYSLGGTSLIAENIQLLCARHNLAKSDRLDS